MKTIVVLCLSLAVASLAHAKNEPFTLDFTKIFAKQAKTSDSFDYNLYEEGCDAADFIVPEGGFIKMKAVEGATCKLAKARALADGSRRFRVLMKIELDSAESCSILVVSPAQKKRAVVNLSCIGT